MYLKTQITKVKVVVEKKNYFLEINTYNSIAFDEMRIYLKQIRLDQLRSLIENLLYNSYFKHFKRKEKI